jgi:nicotinate-nucleotide adenylyltransferase
MKKIGLYFGSFNPIHIGHLIIAEYFANQSDFDEIWLVVSPHNPLKQQNELAPDFHRLEMVKMAIGDNPILKACDFEFHLNKPSYTIHTLDALRIKYPDHLFSMICGQDTINSIHLWKDFNKILDATPVFVFPRFTAADSTSFSPSYKHKISLVTAPRIEISSTQIRNLVLTGKSARYLLTPEVIQYIQANNLYSEKT